MLKKYSRILLAVATTLMLVAMLTGCSGGGTLKAPEMKEGATAVEVTGSCDLAINGNTITVSGETNLPSGVILYVSVESQSGLTLDSAKITTGGDNEKISQEFTMSADKYNDAVESVIGHITFAPRLYGTQPAGIYDKYGDKFENISLSDNVVWNSSGKIVVFASETVNLSK